LLLLFSFFLRGAFLLFTSLNGAIKPGRGVVDIASTSQAAGGGGGAGLSFI
jgi:hypothetical protein